MSQFAPQRGHGSPTAAAPSTDARDRQHHNALSPSPAATENIGSSPVTGRLTQVPLLSSLGSLPPPAPRSPRPPIPSPLSATSNAATSPTSPSHRQRTTPSGQNRSFVAESPSVEETIRQQGVRQTTFYSDSSNPSSPEEELSSLNFSSIPNDNPRSVSDPVTKKSDPDSPRGPKPAMAGAVAAVQAGRQLPRNSSIDTAISAISSKPDTQSSSQNGQQKTPDIAHLIKTAGSPEAVIQYLLKEKQSQSQQNSQLWRLVDKQRAMILGLNKDLEAALKDKEKYRKKLKEVMASPAIMRATGGQANQTLPGSRRGPATPRLDIGGLDKGQAQAAPDSPTLDSESPKNSPIDVTMAPYPITPPADGPHEPLSAVAAVLDPAHSMPKAQEHSRHNYDHEAEEKAADQSRKERGEEQLREIPFNALLPPSRSLPSNPPKMPPPQMPPPKAPPPKPPVSHPPTLNVVEPTPQPNEGLAKFPSPPRKGPPAPLQLKQEIRQNLSSPFIDDDSESDYDDILEVDEIVDTTKRGRRKTREDDDREREVLALREAEARSLSKKSKSTKERSPSDEMPAALQIATAPQEQDLEAEAASLDAVLSGQRTRELIAPPLLSPGLPSSPRPMGNMRLPFHSPPSSARGPPSFAPAPLSPRPPRQPIPLPPNTPLASHHTESSGDTVDSTRALNASKRPEDAKQHAESGRSRDSPTERTRIYKGLVTEEYGDLLLPPNALPSIDLKVASSRMKPSRASLLSLTQLEEDPVFTLAVLSRSDHGELWRVEKDSASLAKLDQRLKQCPSFTARTPDRSLFSGHAPAKLDARRVALEQYFDELLDTPLDTATAVELCKYLSTNVLPPNADETGSAGRSNAEHSAHKIGPDGRPIRSGYLTKKGKNFGGWKARFFMLDEAHLKYYETPGGAHLGTIKLQNAQIGKQSHSNGDQSPAVAINGEELDNQYRHAFLILEPKKKDSSSHVKHVLCAENDKERDLWVDALLQWIDYRDPDDVESLTSKGGVHDRQTSEGPDHPSGGKPKRAGHSKGGHQTPDSDALIGVRYDSTQAGDAPQGAPGRPKTSGGLPEHPSAHSMGGETMSSQTKQTISGPKDPQVISDSAAWGNKAGGLGVPSNDEKKQRKRSFFGFGPKARSSSEGQDSLFGGSDGSSTAAHHANAYHGQVHQVFGAPLAEAVRYNPPVDVNVPLPSVVYRCIQYLDSKDAILEEGIFRLSGSNVVIKGLRERFNNESDINLITDEQYYDIHAVASLLKLYLRELPTTILTRDLHMEFLRTTEMTDRTEKVALLNELAQRLPQANATLLKYLIAFLIRIINNADMNKMTVRNVGIVFSPTLNIPAPVFAMLLQNYEGIFGISAEEYELPSPIPESENQGRFEPPPRPATSSGSASPHRQPRMETRRDQSRTTPTPPLLSNLNAARGSPTPPIGTSRQTYEPSYLGQPSGPGAAARPAYESSFGLPAGHDGHNFQTAHRPVAGYDRTTYQPSNEENNVIIPAYDQPHGTNNRRRESAVIGNTMGLQQQASKSRLREEARF